MIKIDVNEQDGLYLMIHVAVNRKLRDLIEKRRKYLGMTISEYVRWLIREDLIKAGLLDGDDE